MTETETNVVSIETLEQPQDPTLVPADWSLLQRINWVRSKVDYLKKDSTINNRYQAVTHDAVTGYVRQALIEAGVLIVPSLAAHKLSETGTTTKSGVPIMRFEGEYNITVMGGNEQIVIPTVAHALDEGDKAPGKALSYAQKMIILKLFSIETGVDDESRIEQTSNLAFKEEKEAFYRERLANAINEHMDTITTIKAAIKDSGYNILDRKSFTVEFAAEELLSTGVEAWAELTDDQQRSLWVAPSKGGPFSSDERIVMKSDQWKDQFREFKGFPPLDRSGEK